MVQHLCLNRNLNLGDREPADPEGNMIEIGSWNKPYEEKDLEGV